MSGSCSEQSKLTKESSDGTAEPVWKKITGKAQNKMKRFNKKRCGIA